MKNFGGFPGLTGPAVNRSMTGPPFTNSHFGASKNSKVCLDLFTFNPKKDVNHGGRWGIAVRYINLAPLS